MTFSALVVASALLGVESTKYARIANDHDPISADAFLFAGVGAVREVITLNAGLAAISGTSVSLFDAATLQTPNGHRPTGVLRSAEELHSLLHVPTRGHGVGLMAGTARGQIKFFKNVTMTTQQMEVSRTIDFCDGATVPVTRLSHVVFGYKHFVLASSSSKDCGIHVLDVDGDLKQIVPIKGQVASQRIFQRNKLVVAVNSGKDCVLKTYGYKDGMVVTLAEEALRLEHVQCSNDVTVHRDGRLLVAATSSTEASMGDLVHIVDVDSWSDTLTLVSAESVTANAVSAVGANAVLVASDDAVRLFDHNGFEIQRLDMNGAKAVSTLVLGADKRRVAIGSDDGLIRFFDEVPVPEIRTDEGFFRLMNENALCLTADERNGNGYGFGLASLGFYECGGSELSVDHQHWKDRSTGMVNAYLEKCLTGFDLDDTTILLGFWDDSYGCLEALYVDGFLYTDHFDGVPGMYACIADAPSETGSQFSLKHCGSSLKTCKTESFCHIDWRKWEALEYV